MENPEYVFQLLEVFSKLKNKEIPKELKEYMNFVAKTGDPVFQWSFVKVLLKEKLLTVLNEFLAENPALYIPPCPNVDPFNYEVMRTNLLDRIDSFVFEPFTIQRMCELLVHPRKEYNRIDKYMRAVEKNLLVVTARDAHIKHLAETESAGESVVNGILYTNDTHNIYSHSDINDLEGGNRSLSTNTDINDWGESSKNHYDDGGMERAPSMFIDDEIQLDNDKEMQIDVENEQLGVCDDVVPRSFVENVTVEKLLSKNGNEMSNEDINVITNVIYVNSGEILNDQVSQIDKEPTVVTDLGGVSTKVAIGGDLEKRSDKISEMNVNSSVPDELPNPENSFSNSGYVNKNVECSMSDEMNSSIGSSSDKITLPISDKDENINDDAVFEGSSNNGNLNDSCNFDTSVESKVIIDSLTIIPTDYEKVECDSSNLEQNPKITFIENNRNVKSDAIKDVQDQESMALESNLVESSEASESENPPGIISVDSEHVKEVFSPQNKIPEDLATFGENDENKHVVTNIKEN